MKRCRLIPCPPQCPNWSSWSFPRKQLFLCWRGTASLRFSSSPRAQPPPTSLHQKQRATKAHYGETEQALALQDRGKARHCLGLQGGHRRTPRVGKHLSCTPKASLRRSLHAVPNPKHQTSVWKRAQLWQVLTRSNQAFDMYRAALPMHFDNQAFLVSNQATT